MEVVDSGEGRSRLRIAEPETILLQDPVRIDETPLGTGDMPSLEQRFKTLYPQSTEASFNAFARESGTPSRLRQRIGEQEQSFQALNDTLDGWVAIERGELLPMDQRYHKGRFAEAIKRCWQAAHTPSANGCILDLDFHWTSDFLEYLPALDVEFPHVSTLRFRSAELRTNIDGFLDYFPDLKSLDLSDNKLVALPRLKGSLRGLESLDMSANQLTLSAESVAELAELTHLQTLNLGNNPALSLPPDVSRLSELVRLDLHDSGLVDWPQGLFALPRPRGFELDLLDNPIDRLPQVVPGSEQARLVARTRLSRDRLPDPVREQFQTYMRSVGYDPARSYPPKGEKTSVHWLEGVSGSELLGRQATWNQLEAQADSQGFFEVLEQLVESADYIEAANRAELTQRVWRMIDAAAQDAPLREELFGMASHPESCADAGAQIFNEMGIKVLIREAYLAGTPEQVEAALIALAKGKSRLDQVNEIARATVRSRLQAGESFIAVDEDGDMTGTIDEVEIYLSFQTGLAQRLELPWQSRGMLFREIGEVTDARIEQAYDSVLGLEAGEGLVNQIIEQRFWRKYLKSRHQQAFAQNALDFNARLEVLLGRQMTGSLTQQVYERELLALAEERKALLKTLTLDALNKAT
ncbi:NEL-type E3 ubiquitin ligase domain-containing protein [Pseudomonas sp. UV AK001]|uniref:NEL-type E3 ubiquitin ligase domain-containing protein n=1 Tax=Pseudomonas sp. UV AK001 TaxID=3384791 RepID=UPI0038D50932